MISWFFPRRHHRKDHRRRPSPVGSIAPRMRRHAGQPKPRRVCKITILVGFAMHGVQHVSRRPVAGSVFRTSFQQDRRRSFSAGDPPAGSVFCRTYDIHLDQRARVLFGFKKRNGDTESSPRGPRPPRCPRKTQTRQLHLAPFFFLCGTTVYGTARAPHFFSTMPVQSLFH